MESSVALDARPAASATQQRGGIPQQADRISELAERLHAAVNTLEQRLAGILPASDDAKGIVGEVGGSGGPAPITAHLVQSGNSIDTAIDRIQALASRVDL